MADITQADITKAVSDAIAATEAKFTEKLEAEAAKTQRAVDAEKLAKAEARKLKEIDPAEVAALEADNDKLRTELATATKTAKDATTAAEKATKALEAESGVIHKLVAENGLMKALSDEGVTDPAYLEAAKSMLIGNIKVASEGDTRTATFGDKALADAVKEWAGGDVGKKFVSAPNNNGGGAPGGGSGGSKGSAITAEQFNALDAKARSAHFADGGTIQDAAA